MTDFETHPRGTATEIRLSRELANEIEQAGQQWGLGVLPENVLKAYHALSQHYAVQIETEHL
jgi:hypothetical protein